MLEQKIDELNKNLVALIAAIQGTAVATPAKTSTDKEKQPAPKTAASEVAAPTTEAAQKLTLELVAKKGRDTAVALLSDFKVKKASELKPDQIPDFVKQAQAKIAA